MRIFHAIGAAVGATLFLVAVPSGALAEPSDMITVDPTGYIASNGTVTLSGTYRCSDDASPAVVYVGSHLEQDGNEAGIGGTVAECDGNEHRWSNHDQPFRDAFKPGSAKVQGTLLTFSLDFGIPLPRFLSVEDQRITLAPAGQ
jgi:hypothetical protein